MDEWPGLSVEGGGREGGSMVGGGRVMLVLCVRRLYHLLAWENYVACSTT